MNKVALAERLEGYAGVFATESPLAVDLLAMSKALKSMSDEKFASILNREFNADSVEAYESVEAVGIPFQMGGPGYQHGQHLPSTSKMIEDKPYRYQEKRGPVRLIQPPSQEELVKNPSLAKEWADKVEMMLKSASEEVESSSSNVLDETSWNKEASAAVLNNLIKEVTGMDKTVCCDTKRALTKEQKPDGEKKAEKPSSLKTEQTPDVSKKLDSNMVKESKKTPVRKEAGSIKGPGIPDGTGPGKDNPECPKNKAKESYEEEHEETEEKALKQIAEGLELAQEGLEDVKKVEKQEADEEKKEEDGEEKEASKKGAEERLDELEKAKKKEELKSKSRPKGKESSEDLTMVSEGFEFESSLQEANLSPEEQEKLASLFK